MNWIIIGVDNNNNINVWSMSANTYIDGYIDWLLDSDDDNDNDRSIESRQLHKC